MILNRTLPYDPFAAPRLPGVAPMDPAEWLVVDDAFADQMAERARLLRDRRDAVLWLDDRARGAADELLDTVIAALPDGYARNGDRVTRPDGATVRLDRSDPLGTCGALVQEDLCLMTRASDAAEHVLSGAVLCFPAGWRLHDKAGRPLVAIHAPVPGYDGDLARRVQRLFDGVRVGKPMWRFNALWYDDPTLFLASGDSSSHVSRDPARAGFLRTERQGILRLPRSGAVVFSIHTFMLARADALALGAARALHQA